MRIADVIARLALPGVDAAVEADTILRAELADLSGACALRGAAAFLASLPAARCAIVTSAPRVLA